jgi:hypothetical protein
MLLSHCSTVIKVCLSMEGSGSRAESGSIQKIADWIREAKNLRIVRIRIHATGMRMYAYVDVQLVKEVLQREFQGLKV